jgi:hypothetical protein
MDTTAATQVAELVLMIVFSIVSILAAVLVRKGKQFVEAKTGIDIPAKQEDLIDRLVGQGIDFAEEKVHQAVAKRTDKLSGPEKLETAADFVLGFIEARGWNVYTRDLIKNKIESRLGSTR